MWLILYERYDFDLFIKNNSCVTLFLQECIEWIWYLFRVFFMYIMSFFLCCKVVILLAAPKVGLKQFITIHSKFYKRGCAIWVHC